MKKIILLGSSGSIGDSALKVVDAFKGEFKVLGVSVDSNIEKLAAQIKKYAPQVAAITDENAFEQFCVKYKSLLKKTKVVSGKTGLEIAATWPGADLMVSGVVGGAGLKALLAALKMGRTVALANKESLVMAGDLVLDTAKKSGATLLPVDSEHSAMFQCIQGQAGNKIHKIILTASGGPFYKNPQDLSKVSVEKALKHPNWIMGKKITIDSSTLMNKGLEAIEAHFLFNVPLDQIEIVIHPQSIIHSAIEFEDASIIAQLSHPDMCLPIQYAMTYPERKVCPIPRLDFAKMQRLDFAKPDFKEFPCLKLALDAGKIGGTATTVLSAANESAVYAFLDKKIPLSDVSKIVSHALKKHKVIKKPTLEQILEADTFARKTAEEFIQKIKK